MNDMEMNREDPNLANQIVVFGVASARYGIRVDRVREMTSLGHLDEIAGAPPWIAGVIRIREQILPVVDLRIRLGLPRLESERTDITDALNLSRAWHLDNFGCATTRKMGHDATLGQACHEDLFKHRIFEEIPRLRQLADRARCSHKALHEAVESGDVSNEASQEAIETALQRFRSEVDDLGRQLKDGTRPMVIVVSVDDASSCIQVDRVHSVVSFGDDQIERAPLGTLVTTEGQELVSLVVKTPNDPRVIQILDIDELLAAAPIPSASQIGR